MAESRPKPVLKTSGVTRPAFFWHGVLIVLPAIVLAGFGLFSLRQDRILAEHEAIEQAKKIADDLARVRLPEAFRIAAPSVAELTQFAARASSLEEDPIRLLDGGRGAPLPAWLESEGGDLIYPAPMGEAPVPQPLDAAELSASQAELWHAAYRHVFGSTDGFAAIEVLRAFLASAPPERFAAMALFYTGVMFDRTGEFEAARETFKALAGNYPDTVGEAGVSIRILAGLRQLASDTVTGHAAEHAERVQIARWISARAVLAPSPMSLVILARLDALTRASTAMDRPRINSSLRDVVSHARDTWQLHGRARALHQELHSENSQTVESQTNSGVVWLAQNDSGGVEGTRRANWIIWDTPVEGGRWWIPRTEASVRGPIDEAIAKLALPPYLGVDVQIAGRAMLESLPAETVLASAGGFDGSNPAIEGVLVSIHLSDSAQLYARQRARSIRFGLLIALAAGTVVAGFLTARRAFQREQRLGELKSNFVSSVSHELRAPIASVRLMAEELNDNDGMARSKTREYHRFIVQECRRLSCLIENVLDSSRIEQGRKQFEFGSTDLVGLVESTSNLMKSYGSERSITIVPAVTGEPAAVDADGGSLQQVLVNLLDNAIKHSPPGSVVRVGLEFGGPEVRLWVEDDGEGIAPEDHEHIFERFYRCGNELRRETQGVGLGLAIVKYAVEAHRGTVSVRSAVGRGSRFTVALPIERRSRVSWTLSS